MPSAMQLQISIKPEGQLEQMGAAFKGIDFKSDLSKLIKKLSFKVQRESKKLTPVRTGFLRSSIIVWLDPLRGLIHPYAHYAIYVHEGTGRMKSRPFMQWGLDAVIEQSNPEEDYRDIKYKLSRAMEGKK